MFVVLKRVVADLVVEDALVQITCFLQCIIVDGIKNLGSRRWVLESISTVVLSWATVRVIQIIPSKVRNSIYWKNTCELYYGQEQEIVFSCDLPYKMVRSFRAWVVSFSLFLFCSSSQFLSVFISNTDTHFCCWRNTKITDMQLSLTS